jgi:hypothetical protein
MNTPIIVDLEDEKWFLLKQIMDQSTSRPVKQAMSRRGIVPIDKAGLILRILFLSMFFSTDISFVVSELEKRSDLRRFVRADYIPSISSIYQFISVFEENQFLFLVSDVLNSCCPKSNRRKNRTLIIDGSAITLDINSFRKKFRKVDLETKDYRWGFSNTHGYYLGFKLTLVIDYPSLVPLCILLHSGSPHDSGIFNEIMEELKNRRIIRVGDKVVLDKGYFSSKNYQIGVLRYKIIPIIFPRNNYKITKAFSRICYPLGVYSRHDGKKIKDIYKRLVSRLKFEMDRWTEYIPIRSHIENLFKLAKNSVSHQKIHRYSRPSVVKFVSINVLLVGMIILNGFSSKEQLQRISEW